MSLERYNSRRLAAQEQEQRSDPPLVIVRKSVLGPEYNPRSSLDKLGIREIVLGELTSMTVETNQKRPVRHLTESNLLSAKIYKEGDRVASLAYVGINDKREVTLEIPTAHDQDGNDTSLFVAVGIASGDSARELTRLQRANLPVGCLVTLAVEDREPSSDGNKYFAGGLEIPVVLEPARNPDKKQLRAYPNGARVVISGRVTQSGEMISVASPPGETYHVSDPGVTYRNLSGLAIEAGDELISPVMVKGKRSKDLVLGGISPTLITYTAERGDRIYTQKVDGLHDEVKDFLYNQDYQNARAAFGDLALVVDETDQAELIHLANRFPLNERSILDRPSDIPLVKVIHESSGINIATATGDEVLRTQQVIKSVGDEEKSTFVHAGHIIDILNGRTSGAVDRDGTTKPTKAILRVIGDHFGEEALNDVVREQIRDRMKAYEPNVGRRYKADSEMMVVSDAGRTEQRKVFTELLLELGKHGSHDKGEYLAGILEHFLGDPDDMDISRGERNEILETVIVSAAQDKNNLIGLTRKNDEAADSDGIIYSALKGYSREVSDDNRERLAWLLDHIETGNLVKRELESLQAGVAPEYLPVTTSPEAANETKAGGQSQEEQPIVGGGSGENQGVETGEGTQVIEMTVYPAADRAAALQQRAASAASFLTRSREGRGAGGPHPVADETIEDESNPVAAEQAPSSIQSRVKDALEKAIRREAKESPVELVTEIIDIGGPIAEETQGLPVIQPVEGDPVVERTDEQVIQTEVGEVRIAGVTETGLQKRNPGRNLPTNEGSTDMFGNNKANDQTDQ